MPRFFNVDPDHETVLYAAEAVTEVTTETKGVWRLQVQIALELFRLYWVIRMKQSRHPKARDALVALKEVDRFAREGCKRTLRKELHIWDGPPRWELVKRVRGDYPTPPHSYATVHSRG